MILQNPASSSAGFFPPGVWSISFYFLCSQLPSLLSSHHQSHPYTKKKEVTGWRTKTHTQELLHSSYIQLPPHSHGAEYTHPLLAIPHPSSSPISSPKHTHDTWIPAHTTHPFLSSFSKLQNSFRFLCRLKNGGGSCGKNYHFLALKNYIFLTYVLLKLHYDPIFFALFILIPAQLLFYPTL